MTLNIAHRGGAGLYPENTLAAFRNAITLGCDGAELDVQLSRDGEVVVFHDFCLKPEICRNVKGEWLRDPLPRVKDLSLTELRSLDVGRIDPVTEYARNHSSVRAADGERIPTLREVVEMAKDAPKPFRLFVELKTSFADRTVSADPAQLAAATLKVLGMHGFLQSSVLVGFDWTALLHAKVLEPNVECWFTTQPQSWFHDSPRAEDNPPPEPALQILRYWARTASSPWAAGFDAASILHAIKAAGGEGWFTMHNDATPEVVALARSLNLKVGAWTPNDPIEIRRLLGLGLDAVCTDRPDILARIANCSWGNTCDGNVFGRHRI